MIRTVCHILIILMFSAVSLKAQIKCYDNYYIKDTLMYHDDDTLPFTGDYREYYPGNIKSKGHYTRGLKDGEFVNYDRDPEGETIENYSNGLKDGVSKKYIYRNDKKILVRKETFTAGVLDTAIYWSVTGQLEKIRINAGEPEVKSFQIDSNIYEILPLVSLKKGRKLYYTDFISEDSVRVKTAVVICSDCFHESREIRDTIATRDFSVQSFSMTSVCAGSDYVFYCRHGYITREAVQYIERCKPNMFYLYNIIVVDKHGIPCELPSIACKIYYRKSP